MAASSSVSWGVVGHDDSSSASAKSKAGSKRCAWPPSSSLVLFDRGRMHIGASPGPSRACAAYPGQWARAVTARLFAVFPGANIVTFVYAIVSKKEFDGAAKVFGGIALVVGVVCLLVAGASYLMAARPVWDSPRCP